MRTQDVFAAIRALGSISVRRRDGEWRIVPHHLSEECAYYTDDNEDAVVTAARMARECR